MYLCIFEKSEWPRTENEPSLHISSNIAANYLEKQQWVGLSSLQVDSPLVCSVVCVHICASSVAGRLNTITWGLTITFVLFLICMCVHDLKPPRPERC